MILDAVVVLNAGTQQVVGHARTGPCQNRRVGVYEITGGGGPPLPAIRYRRGSGDAVIGTRPGHEATDVRGMVNDRAKPSAATLRSRIEPKPGVVREPSVPPLLLPFAGTVA